MKGHLMNRLTTLGIILVGTVLLGMVLGSMVPSLPEGFETEEDSNNIKKLETDISKDEKHIEDMRKVLRDTVLKIDNLEKQQKNDEKTKLDAQQSKHIEEIREVLSNTIRQLRKDDMLPGGTTCGCASKPLVDPTTGMAEATEGCRPPGWMRMMEREERRHRRQEECSLKQYDSPSV
jgi:hypothetical protein